MPKLTIDEKSIQVPDGATILDAARELDIKIPTLCHVKELSPITSCMLCVVKVEGRKNLLPACGTTAEEGMKVFNDDPDVVLARKTALELLLSDHAGDCMGPCQVACPAGMNIPRMIRYMIEGRNDKAIETIKEHLALPAVTGYICPAPCEKACRRGQVDKPIAVRLIKRCAAEIDLALDSPFKPLVLDHRDKKVAVVGSGPAGLGAAYHLQRNGVLCTVFDDREEPGGMLRYEIPEKELPGSVLDAEIEQIHSLGVVFRQGTRIGSDMSLQELLNSFDAVFLGIGNVTPGNLATLGFDPSKKSLEVNRDTLQTEIPGVFAGGDVRKGLKLAVRSLADGRRAAISILQFLNKETVTGEKRRFNSRMGKLEPDELAQLPSPARKETSNKNTDSENGLDGEQASLESAYCLHCDCRKDSSCKLRIFSEEYEAKAAHYRGRRRTFTLRDEHPDLIYEPGKCISCGICVRITEQKKEKLGLSFIGRGFDVRVAVPFDKEITDGLSKTADEAVKACPTGALAFK